MSSFSSTIFNLDSLLGLTTTIPFIAEPVDEFLWLVIVGGFVCFAMAWGIGANDVANAFATSVGAKAISIKQAVIIAGIFEFLGAFALGATVTNTVRKKITDYTLYEGEGDILMLGMFCSLISAALWLYIATRYQLPVSTTQSIIGAIVGFVLVSKGPEGVVWESIIYIIIFWVASPCLAAIGSMIFFIPSRQFLFRRSDSYEKTLLTWPFWVFIVVFVMTLFLMLKGLKRIDLDYAIEHAIWIAAVCGIVVAIIAWFLFIYTGLVERYVQKQVIKENEHLTKSKSISPEAIAMVKVDSEYDDDNKQQQQQDEEENGGETQTMNNKKQKKYSVASESQSSRMELFREKALHGVNVDIHDNDTLSELEQSIRDNSEDFGIKTEKSFAWLQVCTATLDIFAHGSNDVANAVAPFAAIVSIYETQSIDSKSQVPWWILFIGAAGMTIGLATYGYKIMQCLGVRMGAMSSTRGYCIELSSALVVIIASYYGFPASTTHAQVGATVGVGLCELTQKNTKLKWNNVINWKLLAQVFLGWIATLIVSGLTCAIIFSVLAYSPYAGDVCRE